MKVYFTADTHFGHGRIIQYCNRPFQNAESQDRVILENFCEVLRPGDVLYHLGDISWSSWDVKKYFLSCLPTKEVHLILGNHDRLKEVEYLEMGFRSVSPYKEIRMDVVRGTKDIQGSSTRVVLCHYPLESWNGGYDSGAVHLHGHCHGKLESIRQRRMDVGVDVHNYTPWSWEEIRKYLEARDGIENIKKRSGVN
jgi:calcineurin-like phosphoesterase family protein